MIANQHTASPGLPTASRGGLRILVVQPTGDKMGHHAIFTVKLCQALGKLGHAVTVCTNRISPQPHLQEPPIFAIEAVAEGRLAFARFDQAMGRWPLYYYWGYYRNSYRITAAALALCRSRRFDVVYMIDVEFLVAALLLKKRRGRLPPVVMEVNAANFSFSDYPGSVFRKIYKVLQREVFRTTLGREIAACAVLSDWHRDHLRTQLRLPAAFPLEVIPDGADAVEAPLPRAEARRRLDIDFVGPVFLFFGIIRKDKGIETLLQATARLEAEQFRLVIAGFPMEYPGGQVAELVQRAGVAGKVILRLGYVAAPDVPAYFAAADALVLPYARSYRGASGPLIKETCAYGRPVIATDVSGMGQVVLRHAIGLACPPESPESLAERMRGFLAMPEEDRGAMGQRAAALGRANSWQAMAERFSRLFDRVAGPDKDGP